MQPNQGAVDAWGNPVDAYGQPVAPAQPQVDAFGQPIAQQAPAAQPQVDAYGQPVAAAPAAPAPVIINIQQNWAPAPQGVPSSVPQGLEYLYFVDSLYVKQQMELFEAFTAFETSNRYKVLNSNGQQVYFAGEQSGCVAKCCCGPNRDFEMAITDNLGQEIARFQRPFKPTCRFGLCYPPCFLQEMDVTTGGHVVGKIRQKADCSRPVFSIQNAYDQEVLRIVGPMVTINCCSNVEFEVVTAENVVVGKVSKLWSGMAQEMFTDSDNFGINFPIDLDVNIKLTLMASVFLIDFMFFENNNNKDGGGNNLLCCLLQTILGGGE